MLSILTIAFLIISTIFVYRTARDNGYNAILWSAASVAVFIGVQLIFGLAYVMFLAVVNWGHRISAENYTGTTIIVNLISLAASFGAVLLILRRVNIIKDDEIINVPPPPTFERNDQNPDE